MLQQILEDLDYNLNRYLNNTDSILIHVILILWIAINNIYSAMLVLYKIIRIRLKYY